MTISDQHQAADLLNSIDPLQAAEVIEGHITVTHQPGVMASINATGYPILDLEVMLRPHGSILLISRQLPNTATITLPNPALTGRQTPEGTLGIKQLIQLNVLDHITRMICEQHGLEYSSQTYWKVWPPLAQWTRRMPQKTSRRIRAATQYAELENAVRQLLNAQAWETAQNSAGKVHLNRYNRATAGANAISQLAEDNPGAASWIISQNKAPTGTFNHPGQIVRQVQDRAERAGVEPRYWKTLSRMNPGAMEILMQSHTPQYAAGIVINACGDIQCSPNKLQIDNALMLFGLCRSKSNCITRPVRNEPAINTSARQRLRHVLRLIMKPGGPAESFIRDWLTTNYTADYVVNLIDNDMDITAQTYMGLLKAARRWHQADMQTAAARKVQEQIDRQEGWFASWNSLLDTVAMEDPATPDGPSINAVALTTTPALLKEGSHMKHCVGMYTTQCSRGSSRIFSIRQGKDTLATVELVLRSGRWQPAQTRAWKNHQPPPVAHQAAQALAHAYQARWKETEAPRHHNWLQHPQTSDIKRHLKANIN